MAIDYIPEDDDEDNPLDLAPREDTPQLEFEEMTDERLTEIVRGIIISDIEKLPQSTQTEERLTKIVRGIIIIDVQKVMQSTRACSPSLGEIRGFDARITVDNCNNGDTSFPQEDANKGSNHGKEESSAFSDLEKLWKDKSFVLHILALTEKYAGLLVENHVLDMISAGLEASNSTIITLVCLNLLIELTSQEGIGKRIASTEGLIKAIVEQLFLDDVLCLYPTFRLLDFGLRDTECFEWVRALLPRRITRRLLLIMEKTSDEIVLVKVVELFLTILQSEKSKPAVLIPSLISQGLANLLTCVLAHRTGKLYGDSSFPERYCPALNVILQAIKMLSVMEFYSDRLTFSNRLIELICDLVRYPNTIKLREVQSTAVVLLGNALVDKPHLATDLSRDLRLFRGLLNTFIDTQKDREALWKVLSHILVHIDEREMGTSALLQYVSLLASQSNMMVYNLMGCRRDPPSEHQSTSTSESSNAVVTSLRRIISILREWTRRNANGKQRDSEEEYINDEERIQELLEDCEIRLMDLAG